MTIKPAAGGAAARIEEPKPRIKEAAPEPKREEPQAQEAAKPQDEGNRVDLRA